MAEPKSKPKRSPPAYPGVIDPNCLYTADEACGRLKVGEWAWRGMRRDGLTVLRVAGRAFVTGRALIAYIEEKGRQQEN